MYISSTNENPSNLFGGSWQLIDKEFKSQKLSDTGTGTLLTKTSNTTSYDMYVIYGGHTIRLRLGFTLTAAYDSDSNVDVGQLNFDELGVTGFYNSILQVPAMGDAGNGLLMGNISNSGLVYVSDRIKA